MYTRNLILPPPGTQSFFLWGPRQTGKSTLLRNTYPSALWLDLLRSEEYRRYFEHPSLLRGEVEANPGSQVVIDEVQKVPELLDEVHWLIENRAVRFALCGSSARKVRRGGANLLGGRAIRYQLHGLSASELGDEFDLDKMLAHGYMPHIYDDQQPDLLLDAYVADYLREEVAAESLVRNLPTFSNFLDIAALGDGQVVNFSNIGEECGTSSPTVKNYFEILEDTLLGRFLPAYRKRPKRRVVTAPKFYFADVGVVNHLAKRGAVLPGSAAYGQAFENWVFHELGTFLDYQKINAGLSYWRLASGAEVDFVLGDMHLAVEAKSSERIHDGHLKGLRNLVKDYTVKRRLVVCRELRSRKTEDGIEILNARNFIDRLWDGELI